MHKNFLLVAILAVTSDALRMAVPQLAEATGLHLKEKIGTAACNTGLLDSFDTPATCKAFQTVGADVCKGAILGEMGGEWSACTHLSIYGTNHGPGFARFLSYQMKPRTLLEFGCGLGAHSDIVRRVAGTDVTCIEPENTLAPMMNNMHGCPEGESCQGNPGKFRQLALNIFSEDASQAACVKDLAPKKYDLVMSLEVAEHIPRKTHKDMVRFLGQSTGKFLVFSAARPKQGGTGHLDESMFPSEDWKKTWQEAGLVYMPKLTEMARDSAWFGRAYDITGNVLVFKSADHDAEDTDKMDEGYKHFFYAQGCNTRRYEEQGGGPFSNCAKENQEKFEEFRQAEAKSLWPELTQLVSQVRNHEIKCDK